MARLRRLYAPDTTQLAQVGFAHPLAAPSDATPADSLELLRDWLATEVRGQALALHGWAILPDRIVLLATPARADQIPKVMQGIGRRMATRLSFGRAFEGRYRSALVQDIWVSPALVWTETLAARLGVVDVSLRWPWSSAQEHVGLRPDSGLLTDHPSYWLAGNTPFARQAAHRASLQAGTGSEEARRIERALTGQWALGDELFIQSMATRSSRAAAPKPRGRPRKPATETTVTK